MWGVLKICPKIFRNTKKVAKGTKKHRDQDVDGERCLGLTDGWQINRGGYFSCKSQGQPWATGL